MQRIMDRLAVTVAEQVDRHRLNFNPTAIEHDVLRNYWQLAHRFSNGMTRVFSIPRISLETGREVTREEAERLFLRQIEQEEWRIHNNENN